MFFYYSYGNFGGSDLSFIRSLASIPTLTITPTGKKNETNFLKK